jgi:predicted 2-oxoglutarate/Fe(II)-dependent dioxygenase YbiX
MKNIELAPGIFLYKNILNDIYLNILSNKDINWSNEYVKDIKNGNTKLEYSERNVKSFDVPILNSDKENNHINFFSNEFKKIFLPIERDYCEKMCIELKSHFPYKVLKYEKGGEFDLHMDDGGGTFRRTSTIFYLNDDYLGGELFFPDFNIKIKPEAGDFLIFPSSYAYKHKVFPVIEGTRYAIASWLR